MQASSRLRLCADESLPLIGFALHFAERRRYNERRNLIYWRFSCLEPVDNLALGFS